MREIEQKKLGLLFLHALPLDGTMWAGFADLLPDATFTPTLYDLGNSVQEWASASIRLATCDRLIVVGCSVGGSCALEVAALAPERVEALVLISTKANHRPDPKLRDSTIDILESDGIEKAWTDCWEPLFSKMATPRVVDQAKHIALKQTPSEIITGVSAFHSRPSRGGFATTWRKETVVVTGKDDLVPGVDSSASLAASMPNARCQIVEGSGHYVPLEKPEVLREILAEQIAAARRLM